jgi:hypothetical protein
MLVAKKSQRGGLVPSSTTPLLPPTEKHKRRKLALVLLLLLLIAASGLGVAGFAVSIANVPPPPVDNDDAGFLTGNCNNAAPTYPVCAGAYLNWTFLCVEQQTLYTCNASGWSPFFVLAVANGNSSSTDVSTTESPFIQPTCSMTATIMVDTTAWMVPGETIFIQGGGYYVVQAVDTNMLVTIVNPCFDGNAIPGATVASTPALIGPAGQQGPPGPPGPAGSDAISTLASDYVQPACNTSIVITVDTTMWMAPGLVVFVANGGGYYTVMTVIDPTTVVLYNPCYSENASPGTTIAAPAYVLPAGPPGPAGPSGPPGNGTTTTTTVTTTTPPANSTFNGTSDVVVVGSLAYSADGGNSFTAITVDGFGNGQDVCYSLALNQWIAVGSNGDVTGIYSYDGGNWLTSSLTTILDIAGYAIAWSDQQSLWVAGGQGSVNNIATSSDGLNWVARTIPITGYVRGVVYSPQRAIWVAVGTGGAHIAYSSDGATWSTGAVFVSSYIAQHVSWAAEAGLFLVSFADGGAVASTARSYDGVSWMFYANVFQPQSFVTGSVWNTTRWYITGLGEVDTLATSSDGVAFTGLGKSVISTVSYGACVSSDFKKVFVVGTGAGGSIASIANDGTTTHIDTLNLASAKRCFARYTSVPSIASPPVPTYASDFVSTGQGTSTLAYSLDGGRYFNPAGASMFTFSGYSAAYSLLLNRWVAVGQGPNTGAYSSTGVTWTALPSLTSILTTFGYDVAWSDSQALWVAGGNGATYKIATSTDGITWSGRTSPFNTSVFGVAFSPERNVWVAAGSGTCTLASSPDGITWTLQMGTYQNIVARRVVWSSQLGVFMATLNGGPANALAISSATSVDGVAWRTDSNIFNTSSTGFGVAWNGTQFMLTGQGVNSTSQLNTLASSTDGIVIAELGSAVFTIIGNDACWGSDYGRWVFGGQGTNTVYSVLVSTGVTVSYSPYSIAGFKCSARYAVAPIFTPSAGPIVLADVVVVGISTNTIAYSLTGGRYWAPLGKKYFSVTGGAVKYSVEQSKWIATGTNSAGGGSTFLSSTNGITWTDIPGINLPTAGCNGLLWSANRSVWMVGLGGTVATSSDGITWTNVTTGVTGFADGITHSPALQLFVVAGAIVTPQSIAIASSSDAITWTTRFTAGTQYATTANWAPELGQFFVGHTCNPATCGMPAVTSADGIAWTTRGTLSLPTIFSAEWNGTVWLLGGTGIAFSADGITSTTINGSPYINTALGSFWSANHRRWGVTGQQTTFPSSQTTLYTFDADTGEFIVANVFGDVSFGQGCGYAPREATPY